MDFRERKQKLFDILSATEMKVIKEAAETADGKAITVEKDTWERRINVMGDFHSPDDPCCIWGEALRVLVLDGVEIPRHGKISEYINDGYGYDIDKHDIHAIMNANDCRKSGKDLVQMFRALPIAEPVHDPA